MLVPGRHGVVAGAQVEGEDERVDPVGRGVGQRDRATGRSPRTAATAGARLGHPLRGAPRSRPRGRARRALVVRHARPSRPPSRRAAARPTGVQVDAGGQRRERLADGRQPLRIGQEGGDHGRMIPTMSGLARPELLATTEWLAEQLGRPGVRVLDARWRPDGSAAAVHATGHIPGAVARRLADRPRRRRRGRATRSCSPRPDRIGRARRAPGDRRRHDGRGLRRHPEPVRGPDLVEPAGLRPRVGPGPRRRLSRLGGRGPRGLERRGPPAGDARFTLRGPNRMRLTTADVRGLLGLAGRDAPRRAGAGRVPRLRGQHQAPRPHPGRGQRAGRGDEPAGQPAAARRVGRCATCSTAANVTRGRRMVCYDGSGVAAAKLAFVLTLLGHEDVAVYDGGWAEWGNRLDLPVDR